PGRTKTRLGFAASEMTAFTPFSIRFPTVELLNANRCGEQTFRGSCAYLDGDVSEIGVGYRPDELASLAPAGVQDPLNQSTQVHQIEIWRIEPFDERLSEPEQRYQHPWIGRRNRRPVKIDRLGQFVRSDLRGEFCHSNSFGKMLVRVIPVDSDPLNELPRDEFISTMYRTMMNCIGSANTDRDSLSEAHARTVRAASLTSHGGDSHEKAQG